MNLRVRKINFLVDVIQPLARTTVWSYVKAVRGFVDWMRNEGEDVQAKVRLPRQEHKVIEVLERDEIDRLAAAADS